MPVPTHIFNPPFNVVRCSHAVLTVRDLEASRAFYEHAISVAWRSAIITRWC
jgi:catechol 2,3-dioxygenase